MNLLMNGAAIVAATAAQHSERKQQFKFKYLQLLQRTFAD